MDKGRPSEAVKEVSLQVEELRKDLDSRKRSEEEGVGKAVDMAEWGCDREGG